MSTDLVVLMLKTHIIDLDDESFDFEWLQKSFLPFDFFFVFYTPLFEKHICFVEWSLRKKKVARILLHLGIYFKMFPAAAFGD